MSTDDIQLSKDGIKISYLNYISYSTPGFCMIIAATIACYNNWSLFGVDYPRLFHGPVPSESKIFIGVLALLLAMPIGIIINVTSYFMLEGAVLLLLKTIKNSPFLCKYLLKTTDEIFEVDKINLLFTNDFSKQFSYSMYTEGLLERSEKYSINSSTSSASYTFLRSTSLLLLASTVACAFNLNIKYALLNLCAFAFFISMSTLCRYYNIVDYLSFCISISESNSSPTNDKITEAQMALISSVICPNMKSN